REEQERLENERKQEEIQRLEEKVRSLMTMLATLCVQWERFMRCDGVPNPRDQRAINTFISLWRDDSGSSIAEGLQLCNTLVEELEELLKEATDPKEVLKYQEALIEVQELLHSKHLFIAEKILKGASENIDPGARNMQTMSKHEKLTLCLWANLFKNPNFKGLDFEEAGMGFRIPMHLAGSDIAVRMLHTHYDHLSMLARIRHPSQEQIAEEKTNFERSNKMADFFKYFLSFHVTFLAKARPYSFQPSLSTATDPTVPEVATAGSGAQIVDLMQYTTLGGVFYYDLFHLPPQPIRGKGYTILQIVDGLKEFPYPTGRPNNEACPPLGVSITLPDWVVNMEPPLVARWDAGDEQWRSDGITDVSYEEAEARISFSMETLQTVALMQNTYANLPFRGWELRPLGQNSALFTIKGALLDFSITIQNNQCMLEMEQQRGLSHLTGKWMSGPALQKAMLKAGINIFANKHTHRYVSICKKESLTEQAAYEQMALFASACAFSWSKWNAKCGEEHLVLQFKRREYSCKDCNSWSMYLVGAQRSRKLEITENSAAFSPDHAPGSQFHSTFIHMLQDNMSPDGIAMATNSHYLFVDAVHSLLRATRPLFFS
uniref:Dynein axonemal intermediate chain 7 n=1 Tax=Fundulus heteroclitus TaxID=8078 RepID=A0A3Q2NS59_FUNHE